MFQDLIKKKSPQTKRGLAQRRAKETYLLSKALRCVLRNHQVRECCAGGEQSAALAGAGRLRLPPQQSCRNRGLPLAARRKCPSHSTSSPLPKGSSFWLMSELEGSWTGGWVGAAEKASSPDGRGTRMEWSGWKSHRPVCRRQNSGVGKTSVTINTHIPLFFLLVLASLQHCTASCTLSSSLSKTT